MTQEQLAEQMNVSIQMVSNMENGKKAIRPENLVRLCDALKVSADYVLTGKSVDTDNVIMLGRINALSERDRALLNTMIDYLTEN